jgi:hypothetical protein
MKLKTYILPCAWFFLLNDVAACTKPADPGPREWPGTTLPCDGDGDCVKVPAFWGGCARLYGYVEAIHRQEIDEYARLYREYQERREPTLHQSMLSSDKTCGWMVNPRCRSRRCILVDEKGEITKEELGKLTRTQYVPPEYRKYTPELLRACSFHDDCVKVRSDRCREQYDAVHRRYEKIFPELRYKAVLPIDCSRIAPDPTAAPDVVPVCQQGRCQLVGGLAPITTPLMKGGE